MANDPFSLDYTNPLLQAPKKAAAPKPQPGLLQSILSGLVDPFQKTGKTIAGGEYEGLRALLSPLTDQAKASASRAGVGGKSDKKDPLQELLASFQTSKNPFLSEGGALNKVGGDSAYTLESANQDPLGALLNQTKASAGVASYAVPFGEASLFGKTLPGVGAAGLKGFAAKTLVPGAVTGGLQSFSNDQDIASGALGGAAGAGVLQGVLNAGGLIGRGGKALDKAGANIRQGVSKVEVPSSVYGATKEKQIQKTLNDLGISGSAQAKYEKLQPKMEELSDKIYKELTDNPTAISTSQLKNDFLANLSDKLRTKDLNAAQAKKEITGYLQDLAGKRLGDSFPTADAFALKKLVNADYQGIAKKLGAGSSLTSREKVVAAARQTLDDAIAEANPAVKKLTQQQSHLFDAAESLGVSRNADNGFSLFGTKLPARASQAITDTVGQGVQAVGKPLAAGEGVSQSLSSPLLQSILGQVGARTGAVLNQPANYPQQDSTAIDNGGYDNNEGNDIQSQVNQLSDIIAQQSNQTPTLSLQDYLSLSAANPAGASLFKQLYEQGQQQPKQKNLSPTAANTINLASSGLESLDQLESILNKDNNVLLKQLFPGHLLTRQYDSLAHQAADAILRARTGAQANESEIKLYMDQFLPRLGDDPKTVKTKLTNLRRNFQKTIELQQSTTGGGGEDYSALMQMLGGGVTNG